jgi:thioredoxin reductase (NADPH)
VKTGATGFLGANFSHVEAISRDLSPSIRAHAIVFLASSGVKPVWLLVRARELGARMSAYLVERITGLPNFQVVLGTNIVSLEGENGFLGRAVWREQNGQTMTRAIRHVFLFIGADPNTDWLKGCGGSLDSKGFVVTQECNKPASARLPAR